MKHTHTMLILLILLSSCSCYSMFNHIKQKTTGVNYNMSWSIEMDKYSAITHCTPEQIKTWNCALCKKAEKPENIVYLYNERSSIQGFIGYLPQKKIIIVSWRGTVDITNWIEDFQYYQIAYPSCKNCKVHFGFLTSYLSVQAQLMNTLKNLMSQYPDAKIVSVGSSLGGALATVCALQLQLKTNKVQQLHTFGCPRVGNQQYAKFLQSKIQTTIRVVHNHDIVPHVPLQQQNYHHISSQILYDESMKNYVICDDSGQDPQCSNSYSPDYSIPDHVTYFYKPDLEDLCTV